MNLSESRFPFYKIEVTVSASRCCEGLISRVERVGPPLQNTRGSRCHSLLDFVPTFLTPPPPSLFYFSRLTWVEAPEGLDLKTILFSLHTLFLDDFINTVPIYIQLQGMGQGSFYYFMEQSQEERNILALQMVLRFGIFPEDITLGRSEPIRRAVRVGRNGDKPTSYIHYSSNSRLWNSHKTFVVTLRNHVWELWSLVAMHAWWGHWATDMALNGNMATFIPTNWGAQEH